MHRGSQWKYIQSVYGRLGSGTWSWEALIQDVNGFRNWFEQNMPSLASLPGPVGFGNHRKYESLASTPAVVESYISWVQPPRTHLEVVQSALALAQGNPREAFDILFKNMKVLRFGRTARFDYLAMLGKLELAAIEPGFAYLQASTGPLSGARKFFDSNESAQVLEGYLVQLDQHLSLGMQVIEDALCNWQKSPEQFISFRG
jgi:hypothetical protein